MENQEYQLELGSKATDKHTGFTGIVMAVTSYLYGCSRYGLQPLELKDGKPQDWVWIDEPQLKEVVEEKVKKTGGVRPDAPSR